MLEPRALRIGNWITVMGSLPTQVTAYHLYMMETYVPVDPNEADYKEMTQPIELSEEWLKKAGFNKNHKLILPDRGAFESYLIADSGEQRIQICRTGYWAYDPEIMYVHQLQNLYYALTGNELIFNHG